MGDAILYWNDIALEANRVSHSNGKDEQTGPTLSSRALAIVHLAMYDAFVGAEMPTGALVAPHEVARTVVFLLSDWATGVSGAHLPVDRAQNAPSPDGY